MFDKVLIANRGEIACRVIRTLDRLGVASVAVYSEADVASAHVSMAGEAVLLGPAPAVDSYLKGNLIIEGALKTGAQAIHPGYGFLSENPDFAGMCEDAGVVFIGPTPEQMRRFGLKHTAREIARSAGVPMSPGTGLLETPEAALAAAESIGFPVMLKATAGGGGIGMRLCHAPAELADAFAAVQRLGKNNFKHAGLYLEKYIQRARHVEVQIFGDGRGTVVALGERDCSVQRRNQKVLEETPAPGISPEQRRSLFAAAVKLGEAVSYRSAGTVEFILDADSGRFSFLEVNTRLQVEHGVTELVTGLDLVEWMIRLAAGDLTPLDSFDIKPRGAAIQARVYAEDPSKGFQPSAGVLTSVSMPQDVRVDTWVQTGDEVTAFYDPLIAKVLVHAPTRAEAVDKLCDALKRTRLAGIETNRDYLLHVIGQPTYAEGRATTQFLRDLPYAPEAIEVVKPGTQTTVQDYPGRTGYWAVGVPPSGPMDPLAFRLANRIVGNAPDAAGLECTLTGPTLRFNRAATIALAGADMGATLDGDRAPLWEPIEVKPGATLALKAAKGGGARCYIAFAGGLDVPAYMGSRATFTLGKFGGHGGRALRAGDVLRMTNANVVEPRAVTAEIRPRYTGEWDLRVLYGPHGAPDFFTPDDVAMIFSTEWKVHHHSDRTGVRLIGPHPTWARTDGGEAGLHPSNIHDNAYAIGTIDFTGNLPIILGPDGPSLGGFVCPATVVHADLWKTGQLKAGDTVRFRPVTQDEARALEAAQEQEIESLRPTRPSLRAGRPSAPFDPGSPILHRIAESPNQVAVTYRQDGDKYLLVEYGPLVLDLNLRFRVHALMTWLEQNPVEGVIDLTPGIRSLHIHFDSRVLPLDRLMGVLTAAERRLPPVEEMEVPTRIVHLPLSWDDPATRLAIQKYMQVVRADAPWCPSNIEFIRRINGLADVEQVKEIVFSASYLVMGLGDVYLGAPVATPLDPRHRLVTTKYNPARTWTPENAVGIGGAYLCVYGMEGPGGYQFVGRTVQMWNPHRQTADFTGGKPWLLRFFDQLRFYPVSAAELLRMRQEFPLGRLKLDVEHQTFSLRDYNRFLREHRAGIDTFKRKQQQAFNEERERWDRLGLSNFESATLDDSSAGAGESVAPGLEPVFSEVTGNVWKSLVRKGQVVREGERLAVLESMKTEIEVLSPAAGRIADVFCEVGRLVSAGQLLFAIEP
jgi:urea carboxylase